MSGNAQSMMYVSTSLFVFVSACWLSINMSSQMDHAIQAANEVSRGQARTIQETIRVAGPEIYDGSQVLYTLKERDPLKMSVKVDGITFSGTPLSAADQAMIDLQSYYFVKYSRDSNGNIQALMFTKAPKGTIK